MIPDKATFRKDGSVGISIDCVMCKETHIILLSGEEYTRYFINKEHIQHAMPN